MVVDVKPHRQFNQFKLNQHLLITNYVEELKNILIGRKEGFNRVYILWVKVS